MGKGRTVFKLFFMIAIPSHVAIMGLQMLMGPPLANGSLYHKAFLL